MIFSAVIAAIAGEGPQLASFSLSGLLTVSIAGMVLLLTDKPSRPARARDGLAVAVLWCFGAPIPAAIPFVFGTAEVSMLAAIHEAVSCLTTTGHSVITIGAEGWPASLLIWRGILHVFGMIFSLVTAATVFAAIGFAGPGIHRSILFTLPDGSFFDALPRVLRLIGIVCAILVLLVFSGLAFNNVPPDEALSHAVSVVSTGLVDPEGGRLPTHGWFASLVLFVGLLFATSGMAVLLDMTPTRFRSAAVDPEFYLLVGLTVFIAILAWAGGLRVFEGLGWALSALSTSGLPVWTDMPNVRANLPVTLILLPALVGGSALSTAGGIKLARIIILIRRAGQEFARLGYQHSIVALKFRNRHQKERVVLGVWVYLIAYIAGASGTFIFLSFQGSEFTSAVLNAVGAVSNSGWLIEPSSSGTIGEHLVLTVAMILGRLEIIALVPALSLHFWRK